jgi:hypothetical protein
MKADKRKPSGVIRWAIIIAIIANPTDRTDPTDPSDNAIRLKSGTYFSARAMAFACCDSGGNF